MEQEIITKNGIIYKRKAKDKIYDTVINMKVKKSTFDDLREIASKQGVKFYTFARNILEKYVEENI